ncbi:hypothetical protein ACLBXO_19845 [Methylobacterium sp. C33D]
MNVAQYIQDNVEEAISGVKGANSVEIIGLNLAVLEDLAARIGAEMAQVRGVEDLGIFHVLGRPSFTVAVDREKAGRLGSTPATSSASRRCSARR